MIRKLLHKTQQVYLVFLIAIFLVIAPLFYFIVNSLYITNADESLLLHKTIFINKSLPQLKESDVPVWNKYNTDIKILAPKYLKNDSIFYNIHTNSLEQEEEPYRELL
ncbi:MAG TPA: sensor histidine kinase, partial [Bacteroidetes bacterium]|nr:sensor histidine kinase [Bacteroidota bacterium]